MIMIASIINKIKVIASCLLSISGANYSTKDQALLLQFNFAARGLGYEAVCEVAGYATRRKESPSKALRIRASDS